MLIAKSLYSEIIPSVVRGGALIDVTYHRSINPIGQVTHEWKTLYLFGLRVATWRV